MALPDTSKIVAGTAKVFSGTDYAPTDAGQPDTKDSTCTISGLATGGTARQGVKLNLGSANLDVLWRMKAYIEFDSAPTAGGTVDFYLGFSNDATAGEDNPANLSGADGVFQGYGADTASGTEALKQLTYIGSLIVTNDADIQVAGIGSFVPEFQYCMPVVVNNTSQTLAATDGVETGVAIWPMQHQLQD